MPRFSRWARPDLGAAARVLYQPSLAVERGCSGRDIAGRGGEDVRARSGMNPEAFEQKQSMLLLLVN